MYTAVQIPPKFPGGKEKLNELLSENLVYPASIKEPIKPPVIVFGMIVEKDGSLSDIKILRGASKEFDDEALRVVKLLPKWQSAQHNGLPKRMNYIIVIDFKYAKQDN